MQSTPSAAHAAAKPKPAADAAAAAQPAYPTPSPARQRRGFRTFGKPTADFVLPGAESAAPARPVQTAKAGGRKGEVDPVLAQMTRSREPRRNGTPLAAFHRALATPAAKLFGVLGFAPGQLSIQSVTFTVLGLATAADGQFGHLLAGAAMVYLGLLVDRVDAILSERKGQPGAWTLFLGLVADRLVEISLVVGLGLLAIRGIDHPMRGWVVLPAGWAPILAVVAGAAWLGRRAVEQAAETLLLRTHLLQTRRLPGPNSVMRHAQVRPVIGSLVGRDELVVACVLGMALGQVDVALLALVSAQALLLLEGIVLFHLRLRDPEQEAGRIMGPEYP